MGDELELAIAGSELLSHEGKIAMLAVYRVLRDHDSGGTSDTEPTTGGPENRSESLAEPAGQGHVNLMEYRERRARAQEQHPSSL